MLFWLVWVSVWFCSRCVGGLLLVSCLCLCFVISFCGFICIVYGIVVDLSFVVMSRVMLLCLLMVLLILLLVFELFVSRRGVLFVLCACFGACLAACVVVWFLLASVVCLFPG